MRESVWKGLTYRLAATTATLIVAFIVTGSIPVAGVSGTECRRLMAAGDDSWKEFVPQEIAEFLSA